MTTLTADITSPRQYYIAASTIPTVPSYWTVDSENVRVTGWNYDGPQNTPIAPTSIMWVIQRGVGGTTATTHSSGTTLTEYYPDAPDGRTAIPYLIDGGGSAIAAGAQGFIEVPFACTINAVRMFADVSGSIVVDIWKDTYANFPPLVGDSICASAKPTLSAAAKSQDVTLTGWTTAIAAGDILRYNVEATPATVTLVLVSLTVTRT